MEPSEENSNNNQSQISQQPVDKPMISLELPKINRNSKHSWKLPLLSVVATVLITGITVGITYYAMNQQANSTKSKTDKQIATLQTQITALKKATTTTVTTTITNDQIFNEVANQLGLARSDMLSFKIYGQDKVKYSLISENTNANGGSVIAYKLNGQWNKVIIGTGVGPCTGYTNVPVTYMPLCVENGQGMNVENYSESQAITYIGK